MSVVRQRGERLDSCCRELGSWKVALRYKAAALQETEEQKTPDSIVSSILLFIFDGKL